MKCIILILVMIEHKNFRFKVEIVNGSFTATSMIDLLINIKTYRFKVLIFALS